MIKFSLEVDIDNNQVTKDNHACVAYITSNMVGASPSMGINNPNEIHETK